MGLVHEAAKRNDVEELRRLLDEDPELLEEVTERLWPRQRPLHVACEAGSMEAACLLLDRGADINRGDGEESTAFMLACEAGRAEVVSMLLARGADPTAVSMISGVTSLIAASAAEEGVGTDYVGVIQALLKDGRVPINARRREFRDTALWLACCWGHTERARVLLLEGGADHTVPDSEGVTPLTAARQNGHQDIVELLEWFEGKLERAALLSKARAVVDATESISKAPEKVGAKTEAEAQQARDAAAPAWLRGRVERGEALPSVEVVAQAAAAEEEEDKCRAVCEYIVRHMKEDVFLKLMVALRLR